MTQIFTNAIEDDLGPIHDEIKETLRVSMLPQPFRSWSREPALLQLLWSLVKGNLETHYVEIAADRIRKYAARMVATRRIADPSEPGDMSLFTTQRCRHVIDIHHYVNPKVYLILSALLETLRRHSFSPAKEPNLAIPIVKGIPRAMPTILLLDSTWLSDAKRMVLEEIAEVLALPEISTEYLALAACDGFLERVWLELKPFSRAATYCMFTEHLELLARTLAHGLPLPLNINSELFSRSGITLPAVLNSLVPFYNALPRLILNMAFLKVGLDGVEKASQSPYPLS